MRRSPSLFLTPYPITVGLGKCKCSRTPDFSEAKLKPHDSAQFTNGNNRSSKTEWLLQKPAESSPDTNKFVYEERDRSLRYSGISTGSRAGNRTSHSGWEMRGIRETVTEIQEDNQTLLDMQSPAQGSQWSTPGELWSPSQESQGSTPGATWRQSYFTPMPGHRRSGGSHDASSPYYDITYAPGHRRSASHDSNSPYYDINYAPVGSP